MQVKKERILTDLLARLSSRRRPLLLGGILATSLLGVVAATAVAPGGSTDALATRSVVETLRPLAETLPSPAGQPYVHDDQVRPGDTVNSIFSRMGIDDQAAIAFILETPEGRQAMRQLRAGHPVTAAIHPDGTMARLTLPVGPGERLTVGRGDNGELHLQKQTAETLPAMTEMRSGVIRHSLFAATDASGLPDAVATRLADIFGTEIDFHTDLRRGDQFSVVYEMLHDNGVPVRAGRVLAAEFVNQGKRHVAVLYKNAGDGREQYYTAEGRSLRQGFLRSPLEFSRVTSGFGGRLHPVFKNWRAHNGVDFAAPSGTPVKASSDGVVDFAGSQKGYGNIVILRHHGRYATAYGHLSGFARSLKKGMTVDQGDVIGYVGSTGWATGPHLHYEVRINNEPQDPMRIALPGAEPLGPRDLAAFHAATGPMFDRLALLGSSLQLAETQATQTGAN